jgi:hypothetical protein
MYRSWVTALAGFLLLAANTVAADVIRDTRDVSDFSRIDASGIGRIILTQGDETSLVIEGDEDELEKISTRVAGDTLYIERNSRSWFSFGRDPQITYFLNIEDIEALKMSGSIKAEAENLSSSDMEISLSGSGKVEIASLTSDSLRARVSGSGNLRLGSIATDAVDARVTGSGGIRIGGRAERQEIKISGSGDYLAQDLKGDVVIAAISGSGRARVWANEELDVKISGSGGLRYRGDPEISSRLSGSGKIRPVD